MIQIPLETPLKAFKHREKCACLVLWTQAHRARITARSPRADRPHERWQENIKFVLSVRYNAVNSVTISAAHRRKLIEEMRHWHYLTKIRPNSKKVRPISKAHFCSPIRSHCRQMNEFGVILKRMNSATISVNNVVLRVKIQTNFVETLYLCTKYDKLITSFNDF